MRDHTYPTNKCASTTFAESVEEARQTRNENMSTDHDKSTRLDQVSCYATIRLHPSLADIFPGTTEKNQKLSQECEGTRCAYKLLPRTVRDMPFSVMVADSGCARFANRNGLRLQRRLLLSFQYYLRLRPRRRHHLYPRSVCGRVGASALQSRTASS